MTTPTIPAAPMTAKVALSNLKGDLLLAKANIVAQNRGSYPSAPELIQSASKRVAILEYAVAAVRAFKKAGKSPVKTLAKMRAGDAVKLTDKSLPNTPEQGDDSGDADTEY